MILATEIGDKTFFIGAIMAMRHPRYFFISAFIFLYPTPIGLMPSNYAFMHRLIVFAGAITALFIMTVISAAVGVAMPELFPRKYTHYAAAVLVS